MGTLRNRNRVPNVLFDRRHNIRFFPSIPSIADDDRLIADVLSEQETCPYPLLLLFLNQLRANFWVKIIVPCVSEKSNSASSSAASKIEASSRVIYEENMSYFLSSSQSRASSTTSLPGLPESLCARYDICCFDFSVVVTAIFSKSEVCVIGTCSQFFIAGVLACLSLEADECLSCR